MWANVDLIVSAVAVVAVCSTQAWRVCCADLLLFFSAIAVYFLLSKHFKVKGRPGRRSCKESFDDPVQEYSTQSQYDELSQALDALEEAIADEQHIVKAEEVNQSMPEAEDDVSAEESDTVNEQIESMQQFASARNVAGAMRIFRSLQQSGVCMTSVMYNAVLQAWINCGNIPAAEDWMEDIREAGMTDIESFNTLIKTLVKACALDKAQNLLEQMRDAGVEPNIATFDELVNGCANEERFSEGLALIERMQEAHMRPSNQTIDAVVKLLNGCRSQGESCERLHLILRDFGLKPGGVWSSADACPAAVPHLVAVIDRSKEAPRSLCHHEIVITGTLSKVRKARRTLKQKGFLDRADNDEWPLNGHWETEHGLTVVIEGKLVRWSRQRASRLHFAGSDRRSCVLTLYGAPTQGRLETPGSSPGSNKTLRWSNGDVWHSYDGRVLGQAVFFCQTMTKALRDHEQDQAYRARSDALIRCVSKSGLSMPAIVEEMMLEFIGHDRHYVRLCFNSKWNPRFLDAQDVDADPFDSISRRNPRVGFRHCWADADQGCYGQRALVNGEEVDEECFNRHTKSVTKK